MIKIPKFDANNEIHCKLVELSRRAHELASKEEEEELRVIEKEIDREVARLFGLNEEEVGEVKEALRDVYGKGEETEKEIEGKVAEIKRGEGARGRALG